MLLSPLDKVVNETVDESKAFLQTTHRYIDARVPSGVSGVWIKICGASAYAAVAAGSVQCVQAKGDIQCLEAFRANPSRFGVYLGACASS